MPNTDWKQEFRQWAFYNEKANLTGEQAQEVEKKIETLLEVQRVEDFISWMEKEGNWWDAEERKRITTAYNLFKELGK